MTRQEAISQLDLCKSIIYASGQDWLDERDIVMLDMAIEALQEQKTGKWIGGELGNCSVCGHTGCASDIWDRCAYTFCPNCGAKLEV